MNTDQKELAAYQRAVETAKNELSELRRRAEQAEALALTLQQQRDQAEADAAALRQALISFIRHGVSGVLSPEEADRVQLALGTEAGVAILAVAEAARAYVQAGEYDDLASLLLDLKDKVARWGR